MTQIEQALAFLGPHEPVNCAEDVHRIVEDVRRHVSRRLDATTPAAPKGWDRIDTSVPARNTTGG
jgi:hypothetical protein